MAEDAENNAEVKDEVARNTNLAEDAVEEEAKKPANILEQLFSRGNRLLTLPVLRWLSMMIPDVCWRCLPTERFWFPNHISLTGAF